MITGIISCYICLITINIVVDHASFHIVWSRFLNAHFEYFYWYFVSFDQTKYTLDKSYNHLRNNILLCSLRTIATNANAFRCDLFLTLSRGRTRVIFIRKDLKFVENLLSAEYWFKRLFNLHSKCILITTKLFLSISITCHCSG